MLSDTTRRFHVHFSAKLHTLCVADRWAAGSAKKSRVSIRRAGGSCWVASCQGRHQCTHSWHIFCKWLAAGVHPYLSAGICLLSAKLFCSIGIPEKYHGIVMDISVSSVTCMFVMHHRYSLYLPPLILNVAKWARTYRCFPITDVRLLASESGLKE